MGYPAADIIGRSLDSLRSLGTTEMSDEFANQGGTTIDSSLRSKGDFLFECKMVNDKCKMNVSAKPTD